MKKMEINDNNDNDFLPLGVSPIVGKSPTAKLTKNDESPTWKLVHRKSKSPSSTHRVNKPEGKSYKSSLRVDSTQTGSKRPNIP